MIYFAIQWLLTLISLAIYTRSLPPLLAPALGQVAPAYLGYDNILSAISAVAIVIAVVVQVKRGDESRMPRQQSKNKNNKKDGMSRSKKSKLKNSGESINNTSLAMLKKSTSNASLNSVLNSTAATTNSPEIKQTEPSHLGFSVAANKLRIFALLLIASTVIIASLFFPLCFKLQGPVPTSQYIYGTSVYSVTFLLSLVLVDGLFSLMRRLSISSNGLVFLSTTFGLVFTVLFYSMGGYRLISDRLIDNLISCRCHKTLISGLPLAVGMVLEKGKAIRLRNIITTVLYLGLVYYTAISLRFCTFPSTPRTESDFSFSDFSPRINQTLQYSVLAQGESVTGWISVVDEASMGMRLIRSDMSVLGGVYLASGDSIYVIFQTMELLRLTQFTSEKTRKKDFDMRVLHVGLGIGITANAFMRHGLEVDIIELDPLVYRYAVDYFDLGRGSSSKREGKVFLEDALNVLPKLETGSYDLVVHDVFTGGLMESSLFVPGVFQEIKRILRSDKTGVLGLNVVGSVNDEAFKSVFATMKHVFTHVRCFADEHVEDKIRNFASIKFRPMEEKDFLGSNMRKSYFPRFESLEIKDIDTHGTLINNTVEDRRRLHSAQISSALEHLELMNDIFGQKVWLTFL